MYNSIMCINISAVLYFDYTGVCGCNLLYRLFSLFHYYVNHSRVRETMPYTLEHVKYNANATTLIGYLNKGESLVIGKITVSRCNSM